MRTGNVLVSEGWTGDDLLVGPVDQLLALDDEQDEKDDHEDHVASDHADEGEHDDQEDDHVRPVAPAASDLTEAIA
jgi:hypothetical protein